MRRSPRCPLSVRHHRLLCYAFFRYPDIRLHQEDWRITWWDIRRHVTQGIPLGLQFSVLAVGIIVMQSVVVRFDMLDGVMVSSAAQNGFGAANKLSNLVTTPMNGLGAAMTSFTAQNLGAGEHERIKKGTLQSLAMMAVLVAAAAGIGLLLTRNGFYLHVFLSDDKVTAETIRYGNTFLYVDFSMYIFLGFIFAVRNCVQGIGKSQFVLGAGAAELVAALWSVCCCRRFSPEGRSTRRLRHWRSTHCAWRILSPGSLPTPCC